MLPATGILHGEKNGKITGKKLNIAVMPAEKRKKLLWFRNNLRIQDNPVWECINEGDEVIAFYCIEPFWLQPTPYGWRKMEVFRAKFLLETLSNLTNNLHKLGIQFYVFVAEPHHACSQLKAHFAFDTIVAPIEWTSEECFSEEQIKKQFPNVSWQQFYDGFLIHPDDLPFSVAQLPEVFTHFRKTVEPLWNIRKPKANPKAQFASPQLPLQNKLPRIEELGYTAFEPDSRSAFLYQGGESEGLQHLREYVWELQQILTYKETRNGLVGVAYSTKFSPWLANGSLSPTQLYHEVRRFEKEVKANESTYWVLFELLWRDYFRFVSMKFKDKLFYQSGILQKKYQWKTNEKILQNWISGTTPYDFINANMIELRKTGWMSNRGRQNVASYLAKETETDWRIGASYFEAMLIDYDVHSNYGNWNYLAGVGNDPRDRKFNIALQTQNYDPHKVFRNLWLITP